MLKQGSMQDGFAAPGAPTVDCFIRKHLVNQSLDLRPRCLGDDSLVEQIHSMLCGARTSTEMVE